MNGRKKTDGILFRPSAAKHWLRCPASAVLAARAPDEPTTKPWLIEGTAIHALAETAFRRRVHPGEYALEEFPFTVDEGTEFEREEKIVVTAEHSATALAYLCEIADEERGVRLRGEKLAAVNVEKEIEAEVAGVVIGGTADAVITAPGILSIIDLKTGKRDVVSAEGNEQLLTYAVLAVEVFGYKKLRELALTIVSPRLHEGEMNPVNRWALEDPMGTVKAHRARMEAAIRKAVRGVNKGPESLEYCIGPVQCHWCPGIRYCRALYREAENMIENVGKSPADLSKEAVARIIRNAGPVREFLTEVTTHGTTRALLGEDFPGLKLTETGRAPARYWRDAGRVEKALRARVEDEVVEETDVFEAARPKTPAQVEKVLGAGFVAKYAEKPETVSTRVLVAEESTKGREVVTARKEFGDLLTGKKPKRGKKPIEIELDDVDVDEDFDI